MYTSIIWIFKRVCGCKFIKYPLIVIINAPAEGIAKNMRTKGLIVSIFSFLYIATNGGGVWSVIKGQNWPTTRTEWKTHDTRYQISGRRFTINFITNFSGNGRIGGCWQTCFPAFFSRIPLRQFAVFSSSILRLLQIMYTLWKFSAIFYSIQFSPHPSQEE